MILTFNKDYFKKVIEQRVLWLENTETQLINWDISTEEKRNRKKIDEAGLSIRLLSIAYAMYSAEYTDKKIKEYIDQAIDLMQTNWHSKTVRLATGRKPKRIWHDSYYLNYYIALRSIMALAVLLDCSKERFQIIKDILERDQVKDSLYDLMLSYRFPDRPLGESLSIKKPNNRINEIIRITDTTTCEKELKVYLEKEWSKTYKGSGMFTSHRVTEQNPYTFGGYWAFEVAAIVKIKGLDDSSFRDHKYYPDRLV